MLKRSTFIAALIASTVTLAPAAANAAAAPDGAACEPLPTAKAFKGVDGDTADYSVAPGGGFELGAPGWTLGGAARTVFGNETLGIRPGMRALRLPLGSSATSPTFCVDDTKPHFRFAYKVDNAWLGGVLALVVYRDAAGEVSNVEITSSKRTETTPTRWQASENSPLATILPLDRATKAATVQIKFVSLLPSDFVDELMTAVRGENRYREAMLDAQAIYERTFAAAASPFYNVGVTIDAVMVDPYRRG